MSQWLKQHRSSLFFLACLRCHNWPTMAPSHEFWWYRLSIIGVWRRDWRVVVCWVITFFFSVITFLDILSSIGFPGGLSGKEPACQCRRRKRYGFDPWVERNPWRNAQQPTPVFLPGGSHGERSLAGYSPWGLKELDWSDWAWVQVPVLTEGRQWAGRGAQILLLCFLPPSKWGAPARHSGLWGAVHFSNDFPL